MITVDNLLEKKRRKIWGIEKRGEIFRVVVSFKFVSP